MIVGRFVLVVAATGLAAGCSAPAVPKSLQQAAGAPTVTAVTVPGTPALTGDAAILAAARKYIFRVRNASCLATGTSFELGSTMVTNRHVAAGATTLEIGTWDGTEFNAPVVGHASTLDLARIGGRPPAGTVAATPAGDPVVGEFVYVAGYPEGDQLTVTEGTVVGTVPGSKMGLSGPIYEITAPIKPGNSGSPLLDSGGHVIGVVFASEIIKGYGLAMPISGLSAFLGSNPNKSTLACTAD